MAATITFHPLDNADCIRIDLRDGRKILVDYADMRSYGPSRQHLIDLPKSLRTDLRAAGRDHFDVVLFTHLDDDHTFGAGDFFHFERFSGRQGGDRIRMAELWVPAAALTEEGSSDDAWLIRQEARHRFIAGSGVRVFSRPNRLRDFCERNGIDLEDRKHLITDAGDSVPGFKDLDAPGGVDIFVHNPMAWRLNDREVEERNEDAVVFQAVFREGATDTKVLFASDVNDETLSHVVRSSRRHGNAHRLRWHVFKIPHHCSYRSLNSADKGVDRTVPIEDVRWLCEDQAERQGIMVSTSEGIPAKGTAADLDVQPPHRQAANYYKEAARKVDGQFEVTMDHASRRDPRPCKVEITSLGASFVAAAAVALPYVAAASTPMRAG